jgi:hypothetical protein
VSREVRIVKGIYRSGEKYLARVRVRGKRQQRVFPTIEEAREFIAVNEAKRPAPKGRTPRNRRWVTVEPRNSRMEDNGKLVGGYRVRGAARG